MTTLRLGEGTGTLKIGSAQMDLDVHERPIGSDCIDKIMRNICLRVMGQRMRSVDISGGAIIPLEDLERLYLENVLDNRSDHTYKYLADRLGITPRTLRNKRQQYGFPVPPR